MTRLDIVSWIVAFIALAILVFALSACASRSQNVKDMTAAELCQALHVPDHRCIK